MHVIKLRRCLLLVALATATSGCAGWRQGTLPAPEQGPVSFGAVRLTPREAGRIIVLRDVQVTADSVIGWGEAVMGPTWQEPGDHTRVAVHRSQVLGFESRRGDPWGTAGVVVLTVLLAYGAAVLYALGLYGVGG